MHLKLIACEILYREICAVVARSVNRVDIEFLPKGLHDAGQTRMSKELCETLAAADSPDYDAILLGYGLCSNGLVGLSAQNTKLVVPRAHDCITLFLGNKERYLEYFHSHPGVYFKTSGWTERGDGIVPLGSDSIGQSTSMNLSYEDLVARYGEENAEFLRDQLTEMVHNYSQVTYIEMGIEPDDRFERDAREKASENGWKFEKLQGDIRLLQHLVDGPWDNEEFLVVEPGQRIAASYDDGVIKAESPE